MLVRCYITSMTHNQNTWKILCSHLKRQQNSEEQLPCSTGFMAVWKGFLASRGRLWKWLSTSTIAAVHTWPWKFGFATLSLGVASIWARTSQEWRQEPSPGNSVVRTRGQLKSSHCVVHSCFCFDPDFFASWLCLLSWRGDHSTVRAKTRAEPQPSSPNPGSSTQPIFIFETETICSDWFIFT